MSRRICFSSVLYFVRAGGFLVALWCMGPHAPADNLGIEYSGAETSQNILEWGTGGAPAEGGILPGTEWVFSVIREAKVQMERDPEFLEYQRVISLPDEFDAETKVEVGGSERSIREIVYTLRHRLRQLTQYSHPPDPIVADLFYTLASCEARIGFPQSAIGYLKMSRVYGFTDIPLLNGNMKRFQTIIWVAQVLKVMGIVLAVGAICLVCYCGYRFKWFARGLAENREELGEKKDLY